MTNKDIYNIWAPPDAAWSLWAKPVLFSHLTSYPHDITLPAFDASWAPRADGSTAFVLDLPGNLAVAAAVSLAGLGYRPVPLYNAVPCPTEVSAFTPGVSTPLVICDVAPTMSALAAAAPALQRLNLPAHAPPAFLLDADRRYGAGVTPNPGMFDNRSISLPTDFPSANHLLSQGVKRAILIQLKSLEPQEDLGHTLLRWQQAGIEIAALAISPAPSALTPIQVPKPSLFRSIFHRFQATFGLRRHPLGGFGGFLPIPSSS